MSMNNSLTVEASKTGLRRNIFAGAIGVLVHWFDWAVYAYLATTISHVFFPEQSETAALLSVFAVFAVRLLPAPKCTYTTPTRFRTIRHSFLSASPRTSHFRPSR